MICRCTLSECEAQWTKYLEAEAGSPEAFIGQILLMFGARVADRELESIRQRSIEGQNHARAKGQRIGRPPALTPAQVEVVRQQKAAGMTFPELSDVMEVSESTLKRALRGRRWTSESVETRDPPARVRVLTLPTLMEVARGLKGYDDQKPVLHRRLRL